MSTQLRTIDSFALSEAMSDDVAGIARGLVGVAGGRLDDPVWVLAAREKWNALPHELRAAITRFRRYSGESGRALLRGLPVAGSTLGPTPSAPNSVRRQASVGAAVLMMVAHGLGDPVAFRAEKLGALVQDVVPVPGNEDLQANSGSVELSFHIENAFHDHRPDFVLLLCLRPDHESVSGLRTACIRQVLPRLDPATREALFSNEFGTEPPPSFGGGNAVVHPVLSGDPDDPDVRVDFHATTPLTARARDAMVALREAFAETASTLRLQPGDLAIVDNRVTVHGRTAFTPRYDGNDRWLIRAFVVADLRRSRSFRPSDGHVLAR